MTPPGRRLSALLIVAAVLLACWPALGGDFLADDFGYVQLFGPKPLRAFVSFGDISEGIWGHRLDEPRPLFALTYKLGWMLGGASPIGFLLANLALHAGCALLVFGIARRLVGQDSWAPLLAGLLFGLMPVHSEPICWITGKVDSLPTLFYLGSFSLFVRYRETGRPLAHRLSLAVFALGLLSKEILITLPGVLLAWDALFGAGTTLRERARAWLRRALDAVPFFLFVALYVSLRRLAFGSFARERRAGAGLLREWFARQDFNLRHLLLPFPSVVSHERPETGTAVLAALIVLALGTALFVLLRKPRGNAATLARVLFFGGVFYGVTLVPLLVTYRSARHLYLPSAGVAIALALVLCPRPGRPAPPRIAAALLILGVFAWNLRLLNQDWVDAGALSRSVRGDVERLSRPLPKGAVALLAGVPVGSGEVLVWNSVTPFALRPPFVARDVTAELRLIEHPETYCCRPRAWWPARKPAVEALVSGAADTTRELYLFLWNPVRRSIVLHKARLRAGELRETVEAVLGGPIEDTQDVDERTGARVLAALVAAVRRAD